MFEFVLTACLSYSPAVCVTDRMPIEQQNFSGGGCMMMLPELRLVWEDTHGTAWVIQQVKCESTR
jgi:hypothetical protein